MSSSQDGRRRLPIIRTYADDTGLHSATEPSLKLAPHSIAVAIAAGGGLRRAFQYFDRDRSGRISSEEFKIALKEYTMLEFDDVMFQKIFSSYDDDSCGEVDCERPPF